MTPTEFPEQNILFTHSEAKPLPAYTNGSCIISCWELTDEEIEIITSTRKFYLGVVGKAQPPIWLSAQVPFSDQVEFPETIETE